MKSNWYELHAIALEKVKPLSEDDLMERLILAYPLEEKEEYIGSLVNHYRGRLKNEGVESLLDQMCSNSLKRLIESF